MAPFVAAAAGGTLYFLGYVGFGVWPCLLVFLTPLWAGLERLAARKLGATLLCGFVFGVAAYIGGFRWLWRLVEVFLAGNLVFGATLWALYGCWFAATFALYAALHRAIRRRGWPVAMAAIPPFVLLEWLQPQVFPLYAGNGLVQAPPLWIQLADAGGPLALTALVVGANVVVFETWRWTRGARTRPDVVLAVAVAVLLAAAGYGASRMATVAARAAAAPALRVGLVQANLGVREKGTLGVLTHRRHLEQTRTLLAEGDVDLVVWPETAYVRGIRRPLPISGRPILADLTTPLLFGGSSVEEVDGRRVKSNSAFLIGPDGMIRDVYDKNLLIPLAEHLPLVDVVPGLRAWFPDAEEFGAADATPALHFGPWRIATPICYEAIRPELVRRMMAASDPHLLVTLANDGYFGDSDEPWLHLALARLRAVEHRRFLVRATNSGVSAVVDPAGRLVAASGLLTRENLRAEVRLLEGTTIYGRLGDWPGWLAAVLVGIGLAFRAPHAHGAASAQPGDSAGQASNTVTSTDRSSIT